ncbi:SacI homology domain-containing protein [Diplogelasinospora grovesii]|uniref:SacI homology domain-containing protein n=1 Tax=Diplogelasinospora grovesii TaxID=303347 RepID=A0AAN6N4G6_9PEZI|nr:SacI homology domain-containing protein [Diplogelasinospora grovesii]
MTLPFRDINVQAASDSYIFTSPSSPNAPALTIDRPTGDIRLSDASLRSGKRVSRVSSIAGILGTIRLRLDKYIIVITKAQPVGRLKGAQVYKVISTDLLPLRERQIHDPEEDRFLALLRSSIKAGPMYFSYSVDLTNSFQRQSQQDATSPLWMRTDDRFFWNRYLQSDLIDFRTRGGRGQPAPQPGIDPYILPVIFGMLEIHPTTFKGTPLTIALITRRSRHRAGTRYFTRGLDDEGHVANYNETEQIVILNDASGSGLGGFAGSGNMQSGKLGEEGKEMQVMSYVQTRGSVPVYWSEINNLKYTPKIQIKGTETALPAAKRHFDEQIRIYGDNYLVNLVNQKGREQRVKQAYEQMVEALVSAPPRESREADQRTEEKFHSIEPAEKQSQFDRLHYIYFDFHSETKGLQMHRAQLLIDRLHDALIAQQYFRAVVDNINPSQSGRLDVRNLQTSVVRTNCMDCLDRTNVVQSMLARWTLDRMFVDLGLMSAGARFRDEDSAFEFLFRNMWADNADVVSKSYSGTGAMKTDLTRLGKRTKAGALQDANVAVTRYCKNNFLDGPRQDAFDLFLGAYTAGGADRGSGGLVFVDRRPVLIQSIPYFAAFGLFFVFVAMFTRRVPDAAVWPMRLFIVTCLLVTAWCLHFMVTNGMLYVNWPKLNPRPWATEGYHETISKVRKDKLLGPFVARHERGLSTARYLNAEEGKKRIE